MLFQTKKDALRCSQSLMQQQPTTTKHQCKPAQPASVSVAGAGYHENHEQAKFQRKAMKEGAMEKYLSACLPEMAWRFLFSSHICLVEQGNLKLQNTNESPGLAWNLLQNLRWLTSAATHQCRKTQGRPSIRGLLSPFPQSLDCSSLPLVLRLSRLFGNCHHTVSKFGRVLAPNIEWRRSSCWRRRRWRH